MARQILKNTDNKDMKKMMPQIMDANINRASEGLRVIEDYVRFVAGDKPSTLKLSKIRKKLNSLESPEVKIAHLKSRNTTKDMRAKESPKKRSDTIDMLKANFKRVEEACRVLEEMTGDGTYNSIRYDVYELEKVVILQVMKPDITPGVYLISHDPAILEKGLNWGVSLIQLRDKAASKAEIYKRAKVIQPIAKKKGIPFIINDYMDIAISVDADGLHTGQDDIPVRKQRELFGDHKIIGRTTHSLKQGLKAQKDGADYVSVGPIWDTPSKPNRKGIGFDYLKQAQKELTIPYVAIGGINKETVSDVLDYHPPLIGLIRDVAAIPYIQKQMKTITR